MHLMTSSRNYHAERLCLCFYGSRVQTKDIRQSGLLEISDNKKLMNQHIGVNYESQYKSYSKYTNISR